MSYNLEEPEYPENDDSENEEEKKMWKAALTPETWDTDTLGPRSVGHDKNEDVIPTQAHWKSIRDQVTNIERSIRKKALVSIIFHDIIPTLLLGATVYLLFDIKRTLTR